MGYMHIENLYRPKAQEVLTEESVYCLEKIHGTSAHISFDNSEPPLLTLFSGGANHKNFAALFDTTKLVSLLVEVCPAGSKIIIYGEAYGGKEQGMGHTYGPNLKFIVFDVQIDGKWLTVPEAQFATNVLGLEFVDYVLTSSKLSDLDAQRDRPSVQSVRNGVEGEHKREGIVIRPLHERVNQWGERIIAKHKNTEFQETKTPRVIEPGALKIMEDARAIAVEWVTPTRLAHVLDKLGNPKDHAAIPKIIGAMVEDIYREASGEIVESKETRNQISRLTATMYKKQIETIGA